MYEMFNDKLKSCIDCVIFNLKMKILLEVNPKIKPNSTKYFSSTYNSAETQYTPTKKQP